MQALVEVSNLNPKQGDSGTIKCPKCGSDFNWWKEGVSGKLSGACTNCQTKIPRA